ncbi:hypothetical protein SOVF_080950, partial [Spinacia oleracea]
AEAFGVPCRSSLGLKKKLTARPPPDTVWDLIRDGNPEHVVWTPWLSFRGTYASVRDSYTLSQMRVLFVGRRDPVWYLGEREHPDPSLGGWVLPDARISYTGESGSQIVETVPEDRVFHAPLPEGVQATGTGRVGADDAGPSGGGRGREERERARHSPLRHRRSDVGVSSFEERSEPERRRRSVSAAREPSPELQPQPHFWGDSSWGSSYHGEWSGWTGEAWRHEADDES